MGDPRIGIGDGLVLADKTAQLGESILRARFKSGVGKTFMRQPARGGDEGEGKQQQSGEQQGADHDRISRIKGRMIVSRSFWVRGAAWR